MASRPNITKPVGAKFIAALLAPLPPKEEQPASKRFIQALVKEMKDRWDTAMRDVEDTNRTRSRYCAPGHYHSPERREAEAAHLVTCHRQMLTPAPGRAALNWKKSASKYNGGRPEWEAAIARDEAWIGEFL
ncbi:MAG: hypothetical protein JWR80_8096 [Bradyrhizobium sp.]|nr:hypothetical protein [Bradyrhizobium sp.]